MLMCNFYAQTGKKLPDLWFLSVTATTQNRKASETTEKQNFTSDNCSVIPVFSDHFGQYTAIFTPFTFSVIFHEKKFE